MKIQFQSETLSHTKDIYIMQISKSTNFQPDMAIKFNRRDLLKENKLAHFLLEYLKPHIKIFI